MDATRLATVIAERRKELRLSQQRAADLAGVHRQTWRLWENGSTPEDYNYAGIERALEWARGSVRTIMEGGRPAALPSERDPDSIPEEEIEEALAVMRAGLKRLYPPDEVERRIAHERQQIAKAQQARARRQRPAG